MKVKTLNKEKSASNLALSVLKGVLVGLCVSLVGILLFAFVLRFTSVSDKIISPVNQVIKGISIFAGVFVAMRKHKSLGLLNGLLIGFCYTIVAFLVFSILDGAFSFDKTFLSDLVFGSVIGAICGIICVNLKKN
ncbi:MAG: TIGR04086 family membrane protein [Clostridia bacterium]|nr:TIGR04086 family membrane protein [Clostridia bacterium]